jgi:hypothetical protein
LCPNKMEKNQEYQIASSKSKCIDIFLQKKKLQLVFISE